MKKFTKILIALGATGIAKYIYDHVDIVTNKDLEERIKKEAEVIAKEKACGDVWDKIDMCTVTGAIDDLNKKILSPNEHSGHYTISFCDHVYYDNFFNISKIYLDAEGCPIVFEFENEKDRDNTLEAYYDYLKDCDNVLSVYTIFKIADLIPDDYPNFKKYFVIWDPEDFIKANAENAIQKTINFGEFENLHNYKKECSK